MMWAVSQAAPLRRVHATAGLMLYEYQPPYDAAGYSSGGFMANSQVDGEVYPGSQQQWFTRNSAVQSWQNGVWNHVFVGVAGAPVRTWCVHVRAGLVPSCSPSRRWCHSLSGKWCVHL